MKAFYKLLIMLLVVSMLTVSLASCDAISGLLGKDDGTSDDSGNDNGNNDNKFSNRKAAFFVHFLHFLFLLII